MTRVFTVTLAAVLIAMVACTSVLAAITPVTPFLPTDFAQLGAVEEVMPLLNQAYNFKDTFVGSMLCSVWSMSSGDYLYLYQATTTGKSSLEKLGVMPFYGIKAAGCITGNEPTGFLAGGKAPVEYPAGSGNYFVTYEDGGANVSFDYSAFLGGAVAPGEYTSVLYLVSANAPTLGDLYAIDGGVASVQGYTTVVPEPASLLALGMGAAALLARRRKTN